MPPSDGRINNSSVPLPALLLSIRENSSSFNGCNSRQGLRKSYGSVEAVSGMEFTVERGELYGFLGPNGAGKTTTIRTLTGQIRWASSTDPTTELILETDPTTEPIETRRRVGILPEQGSPPSFLTPREYLRDSSARSAISARASRRSDRGVGRTTRIRKQARHAAPISPAGNNRR